MPMNNVVISKTSTEQEFISEFVKSVMNESAFTSNHTLTCKIGSNITEANAVTVTTNVEVDTQLDTVYGSSSNTPTIWFIIDTYSVIRFSRASNSTDKYFSCSSFFNGVPGESSNYFYFAGGSSSIYRDTVTSRAWKYQILSNANVLLIVFGMYDSKFPFLPADHPSIFSYKKGAEFVCGNRVQSTMRSMNGHDLSAVNRLLYINNDTDPTAIETIQNKVVISSVGTVKNVTMDNVWDSTYNSAVMFPVNIGSSQYVYLDNYTLMPI